MPTLDTSRSNALRSRSRDSGKPLAEMSDEEVLHECQATDDERKRENWGCNLTLLVSFGLTYWLILAKLRDDHASRDWWLPEPVLALGLTVFPGVFIAGLIAVGIQALFSRDRRKIYRDEVARRNHCAGLEALVEEARSFFRSTDHPMAVFLLHARWLPHGGASGACIVLNGPDGLEGTVDTGRIRNVWRQGGHRPESRRARASLTPEECKELRELLTAVQAGRLEVIGSTVRDGAPCRVAALTGDGEWEGMTNLMKYHEDGPVDLTGQVAQSLSRISSSRCGPISYAACDSHGNIAVVSGCEEGAGAKDRLEQSPLP